MKTLILTPNRKETCGMFQLSKDLAKEFDGDIKTKEDDLYSLWSYDTIITLLYPMHKLGQREKQIQGDGTKWICYDQKIPPVTKQMFPNFFRRQYMRWFTWANNRSMRGADEYWDVTEREQKPRWIKKTNCDKPIGKPYALYLGRKTDYKNFIWLQKTMEELEINFMFWNTPQSDSFIHEMLSHAKMLVTASLWEGWGRSVYEAESLGIPAVSFDTGTHKIHTKKGICVPLDLNNMKKSEEDFKKAIKECWHG